MFDPRMMHFIRKRLLPGTLALILILLSHACARFRIEELQPSRVASLEIVPPNAKNPNQLIQGRLAGRVPFNIPIKPITDGKYVYVADPARRLVRIFTAGNGEPAKIIASRAEIVPEGLTFIKVRGGVPGWITVGDGGNVFVEYRLFKEEPADKKAAGKTQKVPAATSPDQRLPGIFNTGDRKANPSVIYHINDDDKVEGVIGLEGPGDKPFGRILRMDAGPDGMLFVCHEEGNKKVFSVYRGGSRIRHYNGFVPGTDEERKKFHVRIEDYAPSPDGKFVVASAVFKSKNSGFRTLFRRIYRLDTPESKPVQLHQTDDEFDFFAWSRPDGGFYLMRDRDRDGTSILFKIYSKDGEYLNNRLVRFPGLRTSWRETYLDLAGKIYTSRLYRGRIDLYEWK